VVDIILQFFIVFQKQTDVGLVWVSDHREIACRYARTWFVRFGLRLRAVFALDTVPDCTMARRCVFWQSTSTSKR